MLNMLKKTFDVPYEDIATYPTRTKAMEAISKYCEADGNLVFLQEMMRLKYPG